MSHSRHTTPSPRLDEYTQIASSLPMRPTTPRLVDTPVGSHCRNCLQYIEHIKLLEQYIDKVLEENRQLVSTNKTIRETYVKIYAKAEQEEEYISNVLLKRIQKLKAEKEMVAQKYEQEEERITNNLMRKMQDVQTERDSMQREMKKEHAEVIDNLIKSVRKTETELDVTRKNLDRMRKEKIDQENALETEQEMLYNTLGKQMEQLNNDKRRMERIIQKAYERGYVDTDDSSMTSASSSFHADPLLMHAAMERPPLAVSPNEARFNELRTTRHTLQVAQQQLREYQQAEIAKDNHIRMLQETIVNLKDDFNRTMNDAVRSFNDRVDQCVSGVYRLESEASMGPPSVPHTPRALHESVSDMDDASSRGSHRDD